MAIIDEIRAEFQKRFEKCQNVSEDNRNALDVQDYYRGKYTAYSEAISFINMLLQEQEKEQHSEDLEEAARQYERSRPFAPDESEPESTRKAFKAGAEWQYQKDRYEFAKLKAKEWMSGYDEGIRKAKEEEK